MKAMDIQDLRTLKILEEIEKDRTASQRHLARQLNVSLGLVNSFIKRLAGKGYFKVTTIPRNRVKYILTPRGFAEKSRLTYNYIHHSVQLYVDARQKLRELFESLAGQSVGSIAFFGASDLAEIAYLSLQETDIALNGVVDETPGRRFFKFTVRPPEDLREMDFDRILITALGNTDAAVERVIELGIDKSRVVRIE